MSDKFQFYSRSADAPPGRGAGEDARRQRKARVFTLAQKKEWDAHRNELLNELLYHKFTQSEEARRVLRLTGTAELWHQMPRAPKEHWVYLETLRGQL